MEAKISREVNNDTAQFKATAITLPLLPYTDRLQIISTHLARDILESLLPGLVLPTQPAEIAYPQRSYSNSLSVFSRNLKSMLDQDDYKNLFRDQIVVDLGAGESLSQGAEIARQAGARAYIAVELHNFKFLNPNFNGPNVVVPLDMKSFCSALAIHAPGSVSFLMSGVGNEITTEHPLASDISKAMHPDGCLIDYDSNFSGYGAGLESDMLIDGIYNLRRWRLA